MNKLSCFLIFSTLVLSISAIFIYPQSPNCQDALGMESGEIPDNRIRTPPDAVMSSKEGRYARLNNKESWCTPSEPNSPGSHFRDNIYIEINLPQKYQISAIALQGSPSSSHSYGKFIQILYRWHGLENKYEVNGNHILQVKNLKDNEIEHLVFTPPFETEQIKLMPAFDSNAKCIRLELYGCGTYSLGEYQIPKSNNTTLITQNLPSTSFNQTDFSKHSTSYTDATRLVFTNLYAWCVLKNADGPLKEYEESATVDLRGTYLVYAIQVNGYITNSNDGITSKYLAPTFKLQYSVGSKWAFVEGGKQFKSADYIEKKLTFSVPLLARYLRIRMQFKPGNLSCIKLQAFGGKALKSSELPPTEITTPTNPSNATNPEARIHYYNTQQGSRYSPTIEWKDTKYERPVSARGDLTGATGCLTDKVGMQDFNPFLKPDCWIGWSKRQNKEPFVKIVLNQKTKVSAVFFRIYVNESMGALTFKNLMLSSGDIALGSFQTLGYLCSPDSYYHTKPQVRDITVKFDPVRLSRLTLMFTYAGDWLLIRQVQIIQDKVEPDALMSTKTRKTCAIPAKQEGGANDSSSTIVIIVCIILALLFLALLAFVIYHYRRGLHQVILKSRKPIIVKTTFDRQNQLLLASRSPSEKSSVNGSMNRVGYSKVYFDNNGASADDVYAAPNVKVNDDMNGNIPSKYTEVAIGDYSQYTNPDVEDGESIKGTMYAQPDKPQQYADPNEPNVNPIYQGSAIYAPTYQNPYNAPVASSMYSDPEKVVKKKSHKVFPRKQLKFKEQIGVGQFGEVWIAEANGLDEIYGSIGHYNSWGLADTALVAVKKLKQSVDKEIEKEFMKEVDVMSQLTHENVVRLLGVCYDEPLLMVAEYMENGDLNQFLQDRVPCNDSVRASRIEPNELTGGILIHMAEQISAGMKYLHAEGFIHRDLATRNCLVGPAYQVKISDFGMSRYLYSKHYYRVEGKAVLPIRWMSPECLFYGKFTTCTDVWSFGVTLWEVFNFAKESPYPSLSDSDVIANACEVVQNPEKGFKYLEKPVSCPDDVYATMKKCWQVFPEDRPTFAYLQRFFKQKSESDEGVV